MNGYDIVLTCSHNLGILDPDTLKLVLVKNPYAYRARIGSNVFREKFKLTDVSFYPAYLLNSPDPSNATDLCIALVDK